MLKKTTPTEQKEAALAFVEIMKQARRKGGRNRMAKAKADGTLMAHMRHMVAVRQARRKQEKDNKTLLQEE